MFKKIAIAYFLLFSALTVSAQKASFKGITIDSQTKSPLIGVNVVVAGGKGASTGPNGRFDIKLDPGTYNISVSYLGYETQKFSITMTGADLEKEVILSEEGKLMKMTVISSSRSEKNVAEETVSIDVISPTVIKNTNAIDLSDAVMRSPGVNVVDGQAQIRAGTGFSYGAGSRVQLLVDDLPLLSPDMQGVYWRFMPIELAENIEIIKGAGSVFYGSSALNGVMHLRTGWGRDKPETEINTFVGVTGNPRIKEQRWWSKVSQPMFGGLSFSHRNKFIDKRMDFVISGNANLEKSPLQDNDQNRYRFHFKTRYHSKKKPTLHYGINGNFMYERSGRFFLWQNSRDGAFKISNGSSDVYYFLSVDPHLDYSDDKGNVHTVRGRYYRTFRFGSNTTPNSVANSAYVDYTYRKTFNEMFALTAGTTANYGWMSSNLYPGKRQTILAAGFAQLEFKYRRLSLVAGGRVEYNQIDTTSFKMMPVFRAGLNYKAAKATFLRASWGQGYRVPSVVEKFLEAELSGVDLRPNSSLLPEYGWNAEIGLKQGIKIKNWLGYFDFAMFWQENRNMIEYVLQFDSGGPFLKPENISRARIAGFETSIAGTGSIGKVNMRFLGGYTYAYAGDLQNAKSQQNVGVYLNNMFKNYGKLLEFGDSTILKYRNRHTLRLDYEVEYGKFTLGTSVNYTSFFENVDAILAGLFDVYNYYEDRRIKRSGDWVIDARLAYQIKHNARVSFIVKNLTNLDYANRPGMMNAPRSYTVQFRFTL